MSRTTGRTSIDWAELHAAARNALSAAYAPYSNYPVAAALLCEDGQIVTGVNVENASYGLTLCAERNAIAAAVSSGARHFKALVVVVAASTPASPCGACRQVLREFPPSFPVRLYAAQGRPVSTTTKALLPASFGPENLTTPRPVRGRVRTRA